MTERVKQEASGSSTAVNAEVTWEHSSADVLVSLSVTSNSWTISSGDWPCLSDNRC